MCSSKKPFGSARSQSARQYVSHTPMGDARFKQLIAELGRCFEKEGMKYSRADLEKEREAAKAAWLKKRAEVIQDIVAKMAQYRLKDDDLM